MSGEWTVNSSHGDAGTFHSAIPTARRAATFHTVDTPTLVLGSAQPDSDVDQRIATALDVQVVRRRSGGGAVLLIPGEFIWLDLVVPADDALWSNDVAHAMLWVGELWRTALAEVALDGTVHRGRLLSTEWSRQVCFAGVGTGEVVDGVGKLVGVSQRRSRGWARFQSMCHLRWRPELVAALVAAPRPVSAEICSSVATAAAPDALSAALIRALP